MELRIAVPDGSMQEKINALFAGAGLPITVKSLRRKEGYVFGVDWIEQVVLMRPIDIPQRLAEGRYDVAIVGQDWIANWGLSFPVLLTMPIGRAGNKPVRVVLAAPVGSGYHDTLDLPDGCEVATEYQQLAERYFAGRGRNDIRVEYSQGNTEDKVRHGAQAIIDVTESGDSLTENDLEIVEVLMESNTVLVANADAYEDQVKRVLLDRLASKLRGAYQASQYVLMIANVPEKELDRAATIIGGLKGPSRMPLHRVDGWFALQSIVPLSDEDKVTSDLLEINVTDIVVIRNIPLIMS